MSPRLRLAAVAALAALAACRRGDDTLRGSGTIEVDEVDVAPMAPARVERVWVDDGSTVRAGDTLVTLSQPTLPADIAGRRARVAAADAALRDLRAGARGAELQRAEAELRTADAEAQRTARDLERMTSLAAGDVISQQQLDAARSAARVAAGRRDAARESLRLLREGARPDRLRAAAAELEGARAALAAAHASASDLVLTAPVNGTVLGRYVQPGEVVPAGTPTLTVGEVSRPWVRVFLRAADLPRVRVGQPVTATLDGVPGRAWAGRVAAISGEAEFTPRVALTEDERADLLFGVKVELSDTTGLLKPGLPATVVFGGTGNGERGMGSRPRGSGFSP